MKYENVYQKAFIAIWSHIKAMPCVRHKYKKCIGCYGRINKRLTAAALDYLRSGDAKNFPWPENPTADLLLLPNLGVRVDLTR